MRKSDEGFHLFRMKRIVILPLLSFLFFYRPACAADYLSYGIFRRVPMTTSAIATGLTFSSRGDDASAVFVDMAGIVTADRASFYADYTDPDDGVGKDEARLGGVIPLGRFTAGIGFFRRSLENGLTENLLIAGAAYILTEGAQGSFLSAGAALKAGNVLNDDSDGSCGICGEGGSSDSELAADMSVMLRPLPFLSFSYVAMNIGEPVFTVEEDREVWGYCGIWGITWFWRDRLAVSWEREDRSCGTLDRYGFVYRTEKPLEVMAGFRDEKVSAGLAWRQNRFRAAAALTPASGGDFTTSLSLEIFFGEAPEDYSQ